MSDKANSTQNPRSVKLTEAQHRALRIYAIYGTGWTYPAAIGVRLATAQKLTERGFLYHNGLDEFTITTAGRAALAAHRD